MTKQTSDEISDMVSQIASRGIVKSVFKSMISEGSLIPEIGFYKKCRSQGINLHTRYANPFDRIEVYVRGLIK